MDMITCDKCHCEIKIGETIFECVEVDVIDDDLTEIKDNAKVFRFCKKCF